jgi:hypothetical protein
MKVIIQKERKGDRKKCKFLELLFLYLFKNWIKKLVS